MQDSIAREMLPTHRQIRNARSVLSKMEDSVSILSASSPVLNIAMRIFGYKLTCALHFEHTGKIVPPDGYVGVRWFSNYDAVNGDIPPELSNLAQGVNTLQQGKWTVDDQFFYTWAVADTREAGFYVGYFRQSFIVAGFVWPPSRRFEAIEEIPMMRPAAALSCLVGELNQLSARPGQRISSEATHL